MSQAALFLPIWAAAHARLLFLFTRKEKEAKRKAARTFAPPQVRLNTGFINTFEDKELPERLFEQMFPGFGEGGCTMKIIIDAFGGDNAPAAVLEGCALARSALAPQYKLELILTGDEEAIRKAAQEKGIDLSGITVVHAPTVIPVCEEPTQILKKYKDCSMAKGLQMLAAGEIGRASCRERVCSIV